MALDGQLIQAFRSLAPPENGSDSRLGAWSDEATIISASQRIGDGPTAWALQEAREALELVEVSFIGVPDLPRQDIARSLETLLLDLLMMLIAPGSPRLAPASIPPMAQAAARREVPIAQIMHSMRTVQNRWMTALIAATGRTTVNWPSVDQLLSASTKIFDEEVNGFIEVYLAERERLLEDHVARRRAAVEALIAGDHLGPGDAQQALGIKLEHFHVGMVICFPPSVSGGRRERIIRAWARQIPEASVLVLPQGRDHLWAWLSAPTTPTVKTLRNLRLPPDTPSITRWSIGQPVSGAQGFRRSHLQAQDLESLFAKGFRPPPADKSIPQRRRVHLWEDHALTTALGHDTERASWYVQATLGPLAENSAAAEELRQTMWAYVNSGLSLVRAAESRHVHRNTVVYRVQRIEELLGHRVKDRTLELHCALLLTRHFGPAVLTQPKT